MNCKLLESQVYIATTGEYRFCCTSVEPSNKETVWTHSPIEWLNSEKVKKAREQFSNGQWPDACSRCRLEEEAGLKSRRLDRQFYGPGITHLDLRFGNSCNLKCISCYSGSSSSLNEESIEMQENSVIPLHTILPQSVSNWYDEKFFSYFENMPLKEVALAGGEPMMIKHLPEFLERLDSSVTIRFTTNVTIYNPKIVNILKKFKKVIMSMSIDAVGKRIEYIRYGSKWSEVETNALRYAEFCKVDATPCISVLNALYYDELREWCDRQQIKLYQENLLLNPAWLHLKNAPDSLKSQIKYFHSWMNHPADVSEQTKFVSTIKRIDEWRKVRIFDYLPEVATAYGIN